MESGPVVVITGASAGVGRATAIAFAKRGWRTALLARGAQGLRGAQEEVERHGGTALPLRVDVSDPEAVQQAAEQVRQAWAKIDVWINNAMVTVFSPFQKMTPDEFRRVTEVTYLGQVYGAMAALKQMRRQGHGTIVCVGSGLSYRSIPLQSAYCGAKAAIRAFIDSLRSELIHDESAIRLTMVHLPAVNTPQFDWARSKMARRPRPVAPVFQPEAAARAIVQAAHEAPRELWVGFSTAEAIAGNMLTPGFADEYLALKAYSGQQSKEDAERDGGDNLFDPVDDEKDFGVYGRFDSEAADHVFSINPTYIRTALGMLAAMGLAFILFTPSKRRDA